VERPCSIRIFQEDALHKQGKERPETNGTFNPFTSHSLNNSGQYWAIPTDSRIDLDMADDAYLVAVKDGQGVPTGYCRCSLCNAEFNGDPRDPRELAISFAVHVLHVHGNRQRSIESVSETSARVAEEAIRKLPKKM